MDQFEKELQADFLEEAAQLLADTEQCFLKLESEPENEETIELIFRLAHSLKGSAGAVGFLEMAKFAHGFESLLLKIKKKEIATDHTTVGLLLKCNDHLKNQVRALRSGTPLVSDASVLAEIELQMTGNRAEAHATPVSEIASEAEVPATVASPSPSPSLDFTRISETQKASSSVGEDDTLRVRAAKVEKLLDSVGELVILQTVLDQNKNILPSQFLQKTVSQLSKLTKEIQESSMSLRMVPLKTLFQKLQRIVRDVSQQLDKEIHLSLYGLDTEIDKTLLEKMSDPLVHIIRNAVDHGVDSKEERAALGKPPIAEIEIRAFQRGRKIVIEVKDDGKGMDPVRIRRAAIDKGLIPHDVILSDNAIYDLIFLPGFSTKSEVSDISGRGIGMDVVARNIEELSGEIEIETEKTKGTTFRLLLPLTIGIMDGMVVTCANERYVIPMSNIHESLQPEVADVHKLHAFGEVLSLRGEHLTMHRLAGLLGKVTNRGASECIALVARDSQRAFAVLVDDIIGQQQVVVKRVGSELSTVRGLVGGAILGDGKAALILDLFELVGAPNQASYLKQGSTTATEATR